MEKRETFAQELCDILVKHKAITREDNIAMHKAFEDSAKAQFVDFLLEEGLVEEAVLLRALSEYYQVPVVDVVGYFFNHDLVRMIPKDVLLRLRTIPMQRDENMLTVVASDPNDSTILEELGKYVSYDIQFRVGLARDICDAVKEYYEPSLTQVSEDDYIDETEREYVEGQELDRLYNEDEE